MREIAWPGSSAELGKEKILEGVKDILGGLKVEISPLIFKWESDATRSHLLLLVYKGKKRHVLRFNESDVEAWPTMPEITGKYIRKILNLAECVLRGQGQELPDGD